MTSTPTRRCSRDHPGRRDRRGLTRAAGSPIRLEHQLPRHGPPEGRRRAIGRGEQPRTRGEAPPVGGNVLLLDEPTYDLDVDTLRALEAGLETFPAASWSLSMTGGSWTASPRTSWRS